MEGEFHGKLSEASSVEHCTVKKGALTIALIYVVFKLRCVFSCFFVGHELLQSGFTWVVFLCQR